MALEFLTCDYPECGKQYILATTMNIRNSKPQAIPLERAPEGVRGNFTVNEDDMQMAKDLAMQDIGPYPVATYGQGDWIPHNPSHFLHAPHFIDEESSGSEHVTFTTQQGIPDD